MTNYILLQGDENSWQTNIYREVSCGYVDGYSVGDRLLEGIVFKITTDGANVFCHVMREHEQRFNKLNQEYWFGEVINYAKNTDLLLSEYSECDVILYDLDKHYSQQLANFYKHPTISKLN